MHIFDHFFLKYMLIKFSPLIDGTKLFPTEYFY